MQALSQARQGEICTIKWMFGVQEVLDFMRERQIEEGSVVRIVNKYKDCLVVAAEQRRIAIGYEVADRIKV